MKGEPDTITAPRAGVPCGPHRASSASHPSVSGRPNWIVSLGALASGLVGAALLLGLVVMHAGLAPTALPAMTMGPQRADMSVAGHGSWMSDGQSAEQRTSMAGGEMAGFASVGVVMFAAVPELVSAMPGGADAGGMPGHAGGLMCLAVLTMVALSVVLPLLGAAGRWMAMRAGGLPPPVVRAGWVAERPPEPSAALARLCVLRT